jgi:phytoene synthase
VEDYAEATSARLVSLALRLLDVPLDAATTAAARDVGIAYALAGLIRAVPFHARQRRVYLPADMLAAHGLTREDVLNGRQGEKLGNVVRELADVALARIAAARSLRRQVGRAAVPALLPAALAERHLKHMRRHGRPRPQPDAGVVPPGDMVRLMLRAWRGHY